MKKEFCKVWERRLSLICVALFLLWGNTAMALIPIQQAKFSMQKRSIALNQVFHEIEKQTGYSFLIRDNDVNINEKVSIDVKNKSVEEALNVLFSGKNISYKLEGNRISVYKSQQSKQNVITGMVVDMMKEPIIGASVMVIGATNGCITNIEGKFSLEVGHLPVKLKISYLGYKAQVIDISNMKPIQVIMNEDTETLDEVVVVGFGSQKKANLTGAVSQVKMDEVLGDRPVTNVKNALQGAMPGLTVSGGSSPGESKSFNIRGTLSINGGSPLVLIDNVEGDIDMLNPEDIESVSVLKDAASSAIYGARAASGVILITTKKAKKNDKFTLNYNNNFGFQTSINQPEQAPLDSYLQAYQDAGMPNTYFANSISVSKWREYLAGYRENPSNYPTVGDHIYVGEDGLPYFLKDSNLYDEFLETSFMQTHNVAASGGTERLRYRIAGGLSKEDGPLIYNKDTYMRKNVSSFLGADITSWYTQEIDFRYSTSDRSVPQSVGDGIYNMNHVSYYPEGMMPESINPGQGGDLPIITPANIIKYQNASNTDVSNTRLFFKAILKPIKGLELVGEYTYDRKDSKGSYYANKWQYTSIQKGSLSSVETDYLKKSNTNNDYNALNLYGTYGFSIQNDHNFKVMAGFNQERKQSSFEEVSVYEMVAPIAPSFGSGLGKTVAVNTYSDYAIRGGFYRVNYNYKDKYLLETNGRYDGSSKFPKDSRFGFFPSVSLGWNIAREEFMKPASNWLGEMKLRGSWGQIGNQNIGNYQFYPNMNPLTGGSYNSNTGGNNPVYWLQDGEHVTYITAPGLVSNSFTWEVVETLDFGFDIVMLNNRLRGTFDWYQRTTKGMLVAGMQLPAVMGVSAPMQNTADMQTTGWELSLNWRDKIGDWNYNFGFNLYDRTSKIKKFNNEDGVLKFKGDGTLDNGIYYVGQKLGEIWGYKSDGYYTIDDFVDATSWKLKDGVTSIEGVNVRPGDEKFKDLSDLTGENQINGGLNNLGDTGDRTVIGNSTARYMYGINLGVGYKGFALSAILQGTAKRDIWVGGSALFPFGGSNVGYRPIYYNQTDYWQPVGDCGGQYTETDMEYWAAKNPDAKLYRIYNTVQNVGSNTRVSDKYLSSAAYLRIKNITFSYTFPKSMIQKIHLSSLKLFASGENLGTFSSLPKGYDPERVNWGYPFYRTISFGLNVTL